jgi:ubiquinone/menaquinone biosynthesis C-methylase UbiE
VLETAAGTGIVTRALRDALPPETRIVATDLNPPMLEVGRRKFRSDENVEFSPADATALPFADESFDLVACQFGVMFFPGKEKSYREVKRVLRAGGRYLFNVWDAHRHNPFGRISHETVAGFFPNDPPQFQRLPFSYTFDEAKDALTEAGFADIEVSVFRMDKTLPEPERLARGIVFGSPLIDQIKGRGGVDPDNVVNALVAAYKDAFPLGTMPLQAMVFSATKP